MRKEINKFVWTCDCCGEETDGGRHIPKSWGSIVYRYGKNQKGHAVYKEFHYCPFCIDMADNAILFWNEVGIVGRAAKVLDPVLDLVNGILKDQHLYDNFPNSTIGLAKDIKDLILGG